MEEKQDREWILYNELLYTLGKYKCGKHERLRKLIKELFPQFQTN